MSWGRAVSLLQMMMVALLLDGVCTLSAPDAVSMDSSEMRHTLRWRPPQASCNTSVLYSVQFQGEFELTELNGSWVDAPDCQLIHHTHCDLTLDLGSDSDYNVRVRAQCGSQSSAWAELQRPFNRRDTARMLPEVKVWAAVQRLHVLFEKLPPTAVVRVTVWKTGDERQAKVYSVSAEEAELVVDALQEGARYCVRAQTVLGTQEQSSITDTQCVSITGPDAAWRSPTTVAVTVVVMASLSVAVLWSVVHWGPNMCKAYFHKEPLPNSLRDAWDVRHRRSRQQLEVCERTHVVQVSLPEEQSGGLLLAVDGGESFQRQRPRDTLQGNKYDEQETVGQSVVPMATRADNTQVTPLVN